MKDVMRRAEAGDRVTIAFLGGSITQGSVASYHSNCYAYLVFDWWVKKFPKTAFTYINAGIGGTTSQFGVARVDSDVLNARPDAVFVEYSVNDDNNEFFKETYEGLIRKIYSNPLEPAVSLIHNIMYNDGKNAQEIHQCVGEYYDLPCVAMKPTIYEQVINGSIPNREITPDDLHPNTEGHALVASVIISYLERVYEERYVEEPAAKTMTEAMTENAYQKSVRYQSYNIKPKMTDWEADATPQRHVYEFFRNGFTATKKGAKITFEVKGSELALQYRKTVSLPAPIARAVVDGDKENAIVLDANFDETWGDCLYMQSLLVHGEDKLHTIEVEVVETHDEDVLPFYLVSVVGSGK